MAVTVIPTSLTLTAIGQTGTSNATQPGNNSPGTWSVSSSNVAIATATINTSGIVTVTMVAVGTCTVTVTGTVSQTATIAVTCDNPVTAIPNTVTIGKTRTASSQLSQPGNSATWSIVSTSNAAIATAVVNGSGLVTISAGTTAGAAIITVQGAASRQATITVNVAPGMPYVALVDPSNTVEYGRVYQPSGFSGRVQGAVYIPAGVTHVVAKIGFDSIAIAAGGFLVQIAQPKCDFDINYTPGPNATKDGGTAAQHVYVGGTTRANATVY